VEAKGKALAETRYFISSRTLPAAEAATAIRDHRAIENRLHRVLDGTFAEDPSSLRKGHGALNMATVRHFAPNLVRAASDKRSIKSRRKVAGWDPDDLVAILASRPA
jgi:predicted transposase YbfD/YdcC